MTDNIVVKLPRFIVTAVAETADGTYCPMDTQVWAADPHEAFHQAVMQYSRRRVPITIIDVLSVPEGVPGLSLES